MTRARLAAALGLALAAVAARPCAAVPGQAASASDAVSAEVRRYFEAVRRNDAAALDALLAQDYLEVSPLGQIDKRPQVIEFYLLAAKAQTGQPSELAEVKLDEITVRVFGDVAIAVVGETFKMNVGGKPFDRPMRSTLLWHRVGGRWKLVSSHHTMVRPPLGTGIGDGR
jgi:uncharacterized protein (TIGR02246 family)